MNKLGNHKKREKKNLTKEEMLIVMNDQVFTDHNFNRHIDETAIRLGLPNEVVKTVVIDYLERVSLDMLRVTKNIRRYVFIGWVFIDILEEKYYEFNNIKSHRYGI